VKEQPVLDYYRFQFTNIIVLLIKKVNSSIRGKLILQKDDKNNKIVRDILQIREPAN